MDTPHTPGQWAWQKFGKQWCLTGQHGMRPIVLSVMKSELTSLVDGRLVAIDPNHPDAQLIASAPSLLAQRDELRAQLDRVMQLIEDGWLVRNTADDAKDGWAIRQMSAVKTLAQARAALNSKD